ncbi:hypothetical protein O6H91_06G042800 [Diphasiastrum complanatum]|uniref:Uncharacterized protein n=4 Tax=Diphasiastrum complanatum TaxID=34168 RepID=A0ACC2DDC6_DIPCM|nr:hypothetical protein O6H91_06G042800 [Diphasiastrum complanatum]KAJ7552125.1 hypothetical protein O6H91_06G042800 [Diphasiastrum complanatum]KAJ7552126.1 hypothetical protein O6H91_06G042800 [Diphasiastrum complanatum]KAJ7552127.1 hypothetical protein O6H91_06G042800 [Diphasiastrum complanatum]
MGKGPGLYSEIGKRAKDLLTKDFLQDQKFTVTSTTSPGLTFTSTSIKKGEEVVGEVHVHVKNKNVTADFKVDTDFNVFPTITVDDIVPGTRTLLTFKLPDVKTGKVEFQYFHKHVGLATSIGLIASPTLDLNGSIGGEGFSLGGEVAYDTATGSFVKYNAGIGFLNPDFSAAAHLTDKGDLLKATYTHTVSPSRQATVGAEIVHRFSISQNTFTVAGLFALDPLTTLKARLNNHGKLGALIQHEWRPKSLVTLSGEVDTKALEKAPKIGLALALKL